MFNRASDFMVAIDSQFRHISTETQLNDEVSETEGKSSLQFLPQVSVGVAPVMIHNICGIPSGQSQELTLQLVRARRYPAQTPLGSAMSSLTHPKTLHSVFILLGYSLFRLLSINKACVAQLGM